MWRNPLSLQSYSNQCFYWPSLPSTLTERLLYSLVRWSSNSWHCPVSGNRVRVYSNCQSEFKLTSLWYVSACEDTMTPDLDLKTKWLFLKSTSPSVQKEEWAGQVWIIPESQYCLADKICVLIPNSSQSNNSHVEGDGREMCSVCVCMCVSCWGVAMSRSNVRRWLSLTEHQVTLEKYSCR